MAVFGDFEEHLARFCVFGDGSKGHFQNDVLAVRAVAIVSAPTTPDGGLDVLSVFQVQERPHLVVAFQNDVAAASSIAPVRASLGDATRSVEMSTSRAALTGSTENLDVINEVIVRHAYRA